MKLIRFLGDSLKCLRAFPSDARQDAGHQLDHVQRGAQPDDFKPMPSIGKGVEELRIWDEAGTFRVIYLARLADAVYVLHAFQKKTQATARYRNRETASGYFDARWLMSKIESFESVWDAIADTPEEAMNMRVRSELMVKIAALIAESGWTQTDAARHCGITQPRINDLLRGRLSRFSLDALVNIAAKLGQRVHVELEAA